MAVQPPWENESYETSKPDSSEQNGIDGLREILVVAKRQKSLLYAFLMLILLAISLPIFIGNITDDVQLIFFPIHLAIIILMARLSLKLYGKAGAIFMIVLSIVPVISILALLIVNAKANKLIKSKGFRVGFLGANTKQIADAI